MLQEFPVLAETQVVVLKAVIGALRHDQVTKVLLLCGASSMFGWGGAIIGQAPRLLRFYDDVLLMVKPYPPIHMYKWWDQAIPKY